MDPVFILTFMFLVVELAVCYLCDQDKKAITEKLLKSRGTAELKKTEM